jgi:adenine/guanine phosphoribosyltransferase-like PRPP-binding protein
MLTKSESAELLQRINAYVASVLVLITTTDTNKRVDVADKTANALDRLLEYVEEIS